jgi:hypothetical protein
MLSPAVHPHMLRHACSFKLANDSHDTRAIQEWIEHSNIQHTTRYTKLTAKRFKSFWQDVVLGRSCWLRRQAHSAIKFRDYNNPIYQAARAAHGRRRLVLLVHHLYT